MSDLNKEALDVWGGLKPMIDQEISSRTQGMVQRRKAKVTTAPSLATNTIGVTEAFGDEMFLPFVSNMISAKVGDFVWIEWMYGATNAFVSSYAAVDDKNVSVAGVLDVVPRRCEAQLPTSGNSAGWYRVLTLTGDSVDRPLGNPSFVIDITIVRQYGSSNNELHNVSLLAVYNSIAFANETSKSNTVVVDKIRYTRNGIYGYIDIHYNTSVANSVAVRFDVKAFQYYQNIFAATTPTAVAASPSGETILTTYDLHANGDYTNTDLTVDGVLDVVPRRCYATLSSAGWYRVCKTADVSGTIIDFSIGRPYGSTPAEAHRISFYVVGGGKSAFLNETSDTNTLFVDKIRCTYGSGFMYFDVHYNSSASNEVLVYFDVYGKGQANGTSVSMGLTSVADSPSGETVLVEYTFAANTGGKITFTPSNCSVYRTCWYARIGNVCYLHIDISGLTANTNTYIFTLPVGFRPGDYMALRGSGQESWAAAARATISTSGDINIFSVDRYALIDGSFICET